MKRKLQSPTQTVISSRITQTVFKSKLVGFATSYPHVDPTKVVLNCIKKAMKKEISRNDCLLECSQLAHNSGIDYANIYHKATGTPFNGNIGAQNETKLKALSLSTTLSASTGVPLETFGSGPEISPKTAAPGEVNKSLQSIALILGISIPILLLILLLLMCLRKKRIKSEFNSMGNISPGLNTNTEKHTSSDKNQEILSDIPSTKFDAPNNSNSSKYDQISNDNSFKSLDTTRSDKKEILSDIPSTKFEAPNNSNSSKYDQTSNDNSSKSLDNPSPSQKMQSGLSTGLYSLYSKDLNPNFFVASPATAFVRRVDSVISEDSFENSTDGIFKSGISQDLRNVQSTEIFYGIDKRISVVPDIYDSNRNSITGRNSAKSVISTHSKDEKTLTEEITTSIPAIASSAGGMAHPIAESEIEVQESMQSANFDAQISLKRQISNEDTMVDDIDSAALELSPENNTPYFGKIEIPPLVLDPKLEKTEEKKQFPVSLVSETPGRFELKQEPKKQSTWAKRKQLASPGAFSEFNPVIPDNEDEEDDIDMYAPPAPTSHVAIESYHPRERDEMYIQKGDLIGIEKEYGDGWARGQNISQSRKRGVFPLAMVTSIKSGPSQAVRKGKNWRGISGLSFETEFQAGSLKLVPRTKSMKRLQRMESRASGTFSISSGDSSKYIQV